MRLSKHFTLAEFVTSQTAERHGIDNTPQQATVENMIWLCEHVLEPYRAEHGAVLISSGFRCIPLNRMVKGAGHRFTDEQIREGTAKGLSYHTYGLAANHTTVGTNLMAAMTWWIAHTDVPWDKVILEYGRWIHIQAPKRGREPRHLAFMKFADSGYAPFDQYVAMRKMGLIA